MRREYWPDLAHHLHIRPWEIRHLTAGELIDACLIAQDVRDETRKAREQAGSR